MVLTERQKKELNLAIYEYFLSEGTTFSRTAEALRDEASIEAEASDSSKCILEKKWTSVVRLQKKVMELEAKIETMQQQQPSINGSHRPGSGIQADSSSSSSDNRSLPRGPAKQSLSGHRAPITAVATHPKYSIFASASEDNSIKIWDFDSAQNERTLKGHTEAVTGLAFDVTGNNLASCSADMSAKLWDLATYSCVKTLKGHDHTLSSVRYSSSGDQVVTCGRDQSIKFWDVNTGYCVRTLNGHTDWVKCLSISLDGELLASGSHDQSIVVWKISTGQKIQVLKGHDHVIESVCFGKKPAAVPLLPPPPASGSSASAASLNLMDISQKTEKTDDTSLVDIIGDEYGYLASGSRDRSVRLWDAQKGICLLVFNAHENWVRCVVFHPSGKFILSSSDDKTIRVMDIKEGRCLRTIGDAHAHFITTLAMSSVSPILISGSVDKNIGIWACS